jgi:hypothetical protein
VPYQRKPVTVEAFQFTVPMRQQLLAAVTVDPRATLQGVSVVFDDGQPFFRIQPNEVDLPALFTRIFVTNWIVDFPGGRRRAYSDRDFTETFEQRILP